MFPRSFNARVAERMAIWGAMLGFLFFLYAATELLQGWKMASIASDMHAAIAALEAQADTKADPKAGKALIEKLEAVHGRETDLLANNRQNKILLTLLILFVIGQFLVREYRWLVDPMVKMAGVLRADSGQAGKIGAEALRRDEIGTLAQALTSHFGMVRRQQQAASEEQAKLAERLSRQEAFKRESVAFQDRIAAIVAQLEDCAGRMSTASHGLTSVSTDADRRAGASAQSTERASAHVDVVATSIKDVAASVTAVATEADKTSAVAADARALVEAASGDAKALTEAARTIEHVMALIEDVAEQTNLLALNATIEAARAGEMGRGFGVVASEVKQLATRTSKATEEVRGGLQGITAASVRIAERVARLVSSIEQVDAVAAVIAASMREQEANTHAITSNTAKTAEDVRDVADTVKHVAAMISEAREAAELVTRVSAELGTQASDLKSVVERFVETSERIAA
ncbi:MAG TPA: methyl-accepting chemotaxis protein [Xanthobacteraceae bacterium]|nr:methyl-accepting chemotaxis protein [Xanthobacteraceae bacterium]